MAVNRYPQLASSKTCTGCMACIDSCAHKALTCEEREDGHIYPKLDKTKCIGCKRCENSCPIVSGYQYRKNGQGLPFAAWALDDKLRLKSASGGVFAAVASHVLKQRGYVVGVINDGEVVKHIIVNKLEDLHLLQGSKYLQSNMVGIYLQVRNLLNKKHLVLFSGTGCQVAALLSFLGREYENLLTADLVCAGVPSNFIMSRFCDEEALKPRTIRWRDKETGWRNSLQLTVTSDGKEYKYKPGNCFLGDAFLAGLTNRYACYDCQFYGVHRQSDLTLADYWGIQEFREQHYKGISLLIGHSQKGMDAIKNSNLAHHPTTWQECINPNPRIAYGKKPYSWMFFERRLLPYAIKFFNYSNLKKIYGGQHIRRNNWLWLPYKLFKYSRWRIMSYMVSKQIYKILKQL